jgi:hypothetical protein
MKRAVLMCAFLAACGGGEGGGEVQATVTVDSVPYLSIGTDDGEDAYELHRVFDAALMPDGQVLVSNSGSHELRVFDSTGTYVRSLGRLGQGPMEFGEFSSQALYPRAGQMIVADEGAMRVHALDASLAFTETRRFTLYPETPRPFLRGVAGNGEWLVQAFANGGSIQGDPGQVIGSMYHLMRYDSLGALADTIIQLPSRPRVVNEHQGNIHFPYLPLSSEPVFTLDGDRLVIVSGNAPALQIYSLAGAVIAEYAWNRPRQRSVDIWDEFKRRSLATMKGEDSARYAGLYEKQLPLPGFAPMYVSVKGDGTGRLWLERFRMPDETRRTWDLIDTDGKWVGTVSTPPDVTVLRIERGVLVGRARDSLGVERVQLFRVR